MTLIKDSLFESIKILCTIDKQPLPDQTILQGVLGDRTLLDPQSAMALLERIGYATDLKTADKSAILGLTDADIVILKDNQAAVIISVTEDGDVKLLRDLDADYEEYSINDFMAIFEGYVLGAKRSEAAAHSMYFEKTEYGNWFKTSVMRISYTYPHIFIASFLINSFLFVVPLYIMNVYDRAVPTGATDTLVAFATGAVLLMLFDYVLRTLRGSLMNRVTTQIDSEMSRGLFHQILNLKLSGSQLTPGGYIEIAREIREMRRFFANATLTAMVDLPFTLLFLFGVYFVAGSLVWVLIVSMVLIMLVNTIIQPMINKSQQSFVRFNSYIQSLTLEVYSSIETIKSLAAENIFQRKYDRAGSLVKSPERYRLLTNVVANLNLFIKNLSVIALIYFGALMIFSMQLTLGKLVAAVMIGSRALMIDHVSSVLSKLSRMKDALASLDKFMQLPSEYDGKKTYAVKSNLSGKISLSGVTYQYDQLSSPTLDNVSLDINAGEHLAVVGPVGSGKSTLAKSIVNLVQHQKGQILLDDIENSEIDPILLRQQVHFMSSDNYVFKGTVFENVRIVKPKATNEEVIAVMQQVGIMNFVTNHPLGVDMPVTDGGANLSSGQRQAIAIARAMLSPAKILILDEPTSFADLEMSAVFMNTLVNKCRDKTIIFITHRLSLCQFMDRVIELVDGKIVRDGASEKVIKELIAKRNLPKS